MKTALYKKAFNMKNRIVHLGIISIFVSLYFLVATISMINSVAFFDLAHTGLMNWALAIGFELGAAASLAAIIILDKTNKTMVWSLFILLTAFQMMANSYHAFVNLENYQGWIELFGLQDEELIFQKRILSIVSGAVLPIVALGFIKSLTDYLRPENNKKKVDTDKYFEERNKILDLHTKLNAEKERARRAENFAKAEADEVDDEVPSPHYSPQPAIYQVEEPESPKVEEPESPKEEPEMPSAGNHSDINVRVDEKTGTTYVETNKTPINKQDDEFLNPL